MWYFGLDVMYKVRADPEPIIDLSAENNSWTTTTYTTFTHEQPVFEMKEIVEGRTAAIGVEESNAKVSKPDTRYVFFLEPNYFWQKGKRWGKRWVGRRRAIRRVLQVWHRQRVQVREVRHERKVRREKGHGKDSSSTIKDRTNYCDFKALLIKTNCSM